MFASQSIECTFPNWNFRNFEMRLSLKRWNTTTHAPTYAQSASSTPPSLFSHSAFLTLLSSRLFIFLLWPTSSYPLSMPFVRCPVKWLSMVAPPHKNRRESISMAVEGTIDWRWSSGEDNHQLFCLVIFGSEVSKWVREKRKRRVEIILSFLKKLLLLNAFF